jgi:hypothetical protein
MKKVLILALLALTVACKQNNCTCSSCLDPTNKEQCCPADDNTGGGCYGEPTDIPIPAAKDVMPEYEVTIPTTEEEYHEEVIPDDELPQE